MRPSLCYLRKSTAYNYFKLTFVPQSLKSYQKIVLAHKPSLQYRRLEQLFFLESNSRSDSDKTIKLGSLTLTQVNASPNIYIIDNFLTAAELQHLHDKYVQCGKFQRSFVDKNEKGASGYDTSHRTSTFLHFTKSQGTRIAAIEQRAAQLLGSWTTRDIEPLQLVRYMPGQFFGVHHDMGDLHDDGMVELPPRHALYKRRLVTIFCYLNDVDEGGATYFPCCDLRVRPKAGRAVVFSNILGNGQIDARTIHAGEPVTNGVKYGLNIWFCEE